MRASDATTAFGAEKAGEEEEMVKAIKWGRGTRPTCKRGCARECVSVKATNLR